MRAIRAIAIAGLVLHPVNYQQSNQFSCRAPPIAIALHNATLRERISDEVLMAQGRVYGHGLHKLESEELSNPLA